MRFYYCVICIKCYFLSSATRILVFGFKYYIINFVRDFPFLSVHVITRPHTQNAAFLIFYFAQKSVKSANLNSIKNMLLNPLSVSARGRKGFTRVVLLTSHLYVVGVSIDHFRLNGKLNMLFIICTIVKLQQLYNRASEWPHLGRELLYMQKVCGSTPIRQ